MKKEKNGISLLVILLAMLASAFLMAGLNKDDVAIAAVLVVLALMWVGFQIIFRNAGIETKKEIIKKKRKKEGVQSIKDMHDLAKLLSLNFQEVHKYVNLKKSTFDNINRMKYLKNNSPVKFKEAILITILNYYKINDIKLIEILSTTKS